MSTAGTPGVADDLPAWWHRALLPGEPRGIGPPGWVELVDSALASAPVEPPPPTGDLSGTAGFAGILAPFTQTAGDRMLDGIARAGARALIDPYALRVGFVEWLGRRLVRLAARTLVLELNVFRVTGRLTGATTADRFASFVSQAATRDGLGALLTEYAVLARLLAQACRHAVEAAVEMVARLATDRPAIIATLLAGHDPGLLRSVRFGAGDGHQRGRTVAILRFHSGEQVVYKPRSLAAHGHFNELARWLNGRLGGPDLRTLALVPRPGYGWVEFIAPLPCSSIEQCERFYVRLGRLLALLYLVDGTDVHYENLIACADDPVLLDVETLFHPSLPPPGLGDDPAARAFEASVYRTALLPRLMLGDDTAVDISGIGGDKGASSPIDGVDFEAAGTDEMRLVRRAGVFPGADNRPVLDGADADPGRFAEHLVAGFRHAHMSMYAGRDELIGAHGVLSRFADDVVRVVARPTLLYATLLDETTHPDLMRDAGDRGRLLEQLRTDSANDRGRLLLVDVEIADLWAGDIPLLTSRPGSTALWGGTGRRIDGVLERSGLAAVGNKVIAMDSVDRQRQEWIIRATLASRTGTDPHEIAGVGRGHAGLRDARSRAGAPEAGPDRLLAAACTIADQILATAYDNGTRTNWLGMDELGEREWRPGPLGAGLGHGYCGTALFLAQLAELTGDRRYADRARRALSAVADLLAGLGAVPERLGAVGCGGFSGLGGIAYTLALTATLLDDGELRGSIDPAAQLVTASLAAAAEEDAGVAGGIAGGLATLLAIHSTTGSAVAWRGAQTCAGRLVATPLPAAAGFACGAAGVGWALLRFVAAGGDARFAAPGRAALGQAAGPATSLSWCRGLVGTSLAVLDSPAPQQPAGWVERRAMRTLRLAGPLPDDSLCHGELGALELFATDPAQDPVRAERVATLLAALGRRGPQCGTPGRVTSPGLLAGLAGIGHGLLRMAFPNRIPSALLLRPLTR